VPNFGSPLFAQAQLRTMGHARGHLDLDFAVKGRHCYPGTEHRIGDIDLTRMPQVRPFSLEQRVGSDLITISRLPGLPPDSPFAILSNGTASSTTMSAPRSGPH